MLTSLAWAFFWIPFGIGYYGLPWQDLAFRSYIQWWAWCHLSLGCILLMIVLVQRWWRQGMVDFIAVGLSLFSIWAMYDWFARYVRAL
jgi:hypothetical protein